MNPFCIFPPSYLGVRQDDLHGAGAYGATRDHGKRRHAGIDFVVRPGDKVRAPIDGWIVHVGQAYEDTNEFGSLHVLSSLWPWVRVRLLYVLANYPNGAWVGLGEPLGLAQDISRRYRGMTPHVHLELLISDNPVDPTDYIIGGTPLGAAPLREA